MAGILGEGIYTAGIYARGGTDSLFGLRGISAVSWGRRKNTPSEGTVTVSPDDPRLGDIATWGHELVIFRNGARFWEGPIVKPLWRRDSVVLTARDVTGYFPRRIHRSALPKNVKHQRKRVITFAESDVRAAFEHDDPNVLDWLDVRGDKKGHYVTRKVKTEHEVQYVTETLEGLAERGLQWTAVGRRIVLWPSAVNLGRLPTLEPYLHLREDVEVYEDGDALATKVAMVPNKGRTRWSKQGQEVHDFYGLHEFRGDATGLKGGSELVDAANATRDEKFPAPTVVTIPAGATLTVDSPYPIETLVPGVILPVEVRNLVRPVRATMGLSEVTVTAGPKGETVQITLEQVSDAALVDGLEDPDTWVPEEV